MSHDAKHEAKKMQQLVGATLVKVFVDENAGFNGAPVLVFEKDGQKFEVAVLSDQEGNDCGALCIYKA